MPRSYRRLTKRRKAQRSRRHRRQKYRGGSIADYTGKHVLVTGGAGFIGSNLVDALLEAGAALVRVVDNLSTGKSSNLDAARTAAGDRLEEILGTTEGDITNPEVCMRACEGIDIIFHEAALVSVPRSMVEPLLNHDINITGTLNMLIAAGKAGVQRFVYASSAATYGSLPEIPKVETQPRDYPSPYALSKGVCEDYANLFASKTELGTPPKPEGVENNTAPPNISCVGLRYFNVYGPRQDPKSVYSGVISIFASNMAAGLPVKVFGDGKNTRDFVFVGDVVQANLLAGIKPLEGGHVFNVGTGRETTLLELIETIKGITGKEVDVQFFEPRAGDIKYSVSDISKIRSELGYEPQFTLEEGLKKLLNA